MNAFIQNTYIIITRVSNKSFPKQSFKLYLKTEYFLFEYKNKNIGICKYLAGIYMYIIFKKYCNCLIHIIQIRQW